MYINKDTLKTKKLIKSLEDTGVKHEKTKQMGIR